MTDRLEFTFSLIVMKLSSHACTVSSLFRMVQFPINEEQQWLGLKWRVSFQTVSWRQPQTCLDMFKNVGESWADYQAPQRPTNGSYYLGCHLLDGRTLFVIIFTHWEHSGRLTTFYHRLCYRTFCDRMGSIFNSIMPRGTYHVFLELSSKFRYTFVTS